MTTAVLPVAITGATTETRPRNDDCCGATTVTTPVGSGVDRLKKGPATGFAPPTIWPILSVHPAYQTQRSMAASTTAVALDFDSPSASATSRTNWPLRPSSISAMR